MSAMSITSSRRGRLRLVFKEQGKEARFYSWPKYFVSLISPSIGIRLFLLCNVGPLVPPKLNSFL